MAEKKLSEELRHCLEGKGCENCSNYQSESRLTCPGLLQKAYEAVKEYEDFEEIFHSKMTDAACDFLKDKEEFAKWLDRNKWIAKKCDEYARAEEQGKLLKLPCAVGDKVYKIWSCGKNGKTIAEFIVSHIDIDYLPDIEFSYRKENGHGNYYFSKIEDIGKTVFLTKSAAERALKETEGEK